MKILVLIESVKVDQHSGAIVGMNYINALSKGENEIHVLYPDQVILGMPNPEPKWLENVKTKRFYIHEESLFTAIINKIPKIRAFPAVLYGANFERMRWIVSWREAIESEINDQTFDLIIALGIGAVFAPHFAMQKVQTDIPWMAYIHDPFPFHHYPEPYRTKSTISKRAQARRFDIVLKKATYVGFPSLRLKEWMEQYYPILLNKSIISPHAAYSDSLKNHHEDGQEIIFDNSKFNLLHAGSLLGHRDPTTLIKSFHKFIGNDSEKIEKAHLYILGGVPDGYEQIKTNQDTNIHLVKKRVSYINSLQLLDQATVLVLLETSAKESPFMPGKLSDYIKSDKPILALTPIKSETTRLLGHNFPYLSEVNNTEKIYSCLNQLWSEWKVNKLSGLNRPDLQKYIGAENICNIVESLKANK